ncbi:MAG: response regulator transcription factor [Lachnospiraceae bacterium]|nr:response regulator transcription factor [Lachnospiraceae bacterium]
MEEKQYRILIAEDDADIIEVLKLYLENQGYRILSAEDGAAAYRLIEKEKVDLGIFDIMMPKMNGFELIRKVREKYNLPIIVLSAKKEDSDKILGLDLGADDYLVKPFNPLEVVARVKAAFRRFYDLNTGTDEVREQEILRYKELEINMQTLQLFKGGEEIKVTPTEIRILMLLMKNPGRVYTKVQIYEYLRGEYFENDENTIMVHISNLRDKIEDDPKKPEYLLTVRGLGYKLGVARL